MNQVKGIGKIRKIDSLVLLMLAVLTVLALFIRFHQLSPFIYQTNDDLFLKTIASGEVTGTPDAHLYFIGYPIGLLISSLYKIAPALPWYGIFLCFSFGLTLVIVLFELMKAEAKWISRVLTIVLFAVTVYGMLFLHIAELQFTMVTGTVGAGAVFLFYMADCSGSWKECLKSSIAFLAVCAFALCIRRDGALMLLPILGMIWLGKFLDAGHGSAKDSETVSLIGRKIAKTRRNLLGLAIILAGLILLVTGVEKLAYHTDTWKTFRDYTQARATVYDYDGYPDYEENQDVYDSLGITEASYEAAAHHYSILLDDHISAEALNRLLTCGSRDEGSVMVRLQEMFSAFVERHLSYTDRPLNLFVYAEYLLFFTIAVLGKNKKAIRDILFLVAGRMVIWIYLLYLGRYPSRVTQAIYLTELILLLAIAWKNRLWENHMQKEQGQKEQGQKEQGQKDNMPGKLLWEKRMWISFAAGVLILMAVVVRFGLPKAAAARSEASSRATFSEAFTELNGYFAQHPDQFYLLDMNSFSSFTEDALQGGENSYDNYALMGSWLPHSPWYQVKYKHQGITDVEQQALQGNAIYFVFMDTPDTGYEYLTDYYQALDPEVQISKADEVVTQNGVTFLILSARTAENAK